MRLSWRYRSPIGGNESARNVRREKECNGGLCDFHSVLIQLLSIKCSGSCVDMNYVVFRVSRSGINVVFCAAVVVDVVHSNSRRRVEEGKSESVSET